MRPKGPKKRQQMQHHIKFPAPITLLAYVGVSLAHTEQNVPPVLLLLILMIMGWPWDGWGGGGGGA